MALLIWDVGWANSGYVDATQNKTWKPLYYCKHLMRVFNTHVKYTLPLWNTRGQELEWSFFIMLRQDIHGPRAEQFLSCGQKLHNINSRNSIKAGWWSRLGPAQIRDRSSTVILGSLSPQCLEAGLSGFQPEIEATSFWPPLSLSVPVVGNALLTSMRNTCSFISYLGKAHSLLHHPAFMELLLL